MTIVAIDDSQFNLELLQAVLQPLDHTIVCFTDPAAALAALDDLEPVLVITDHLMPVMEGVELVSRLRRMSAHADVPVLMLTSADERAVRLSAFDAGVTDFATRPVDPVELCARASALSRLGAAQREMKRQAVLLASEVRDTSVNLAAVLEAGPGMLSHLKRDPAGAWRVHWASGYVTRLTGYTRAEYCEDGFEATASAIDPGPARAAVLQSCDNPGIASWDYPFRRKDGSWIRLGEHLKRTVNGLGEEEVIAYTYDCTAQFEAAREIRAAKERLDTLLSAAPGALFQIEWPGRSPDGVPFLAGAIERVTGYAPDTLPDGGLFGLYDAPSREQHGAAMARSLEGEQASYEARLRRRDGTWIWAEVRLSASPSGAGRTITGHIADVTRERETRMQLERTRLELKTVVDSGPGALFTLRYGPGVTEKSVLFASDAFERLTGYSTEEVINPDWFESISDPEHWGGMLEARRSALACSPATVALRIRSKAGQWRWMQITLQPHDKMPDGSVVVTGYMTDITEQRARDARMVQTMKLATLGEMATSMAHELNQPLAIISFAAQNARMAAQQGGDIQSRLDRIVSQAHRASRLIDHLRVFGRTQDSGTMPVAWADVISGAMLLAGAKLRMASVSVDIALPKDLPNVEGNAVLLEQVLLNIVSNACDAYTEGPPQVPGVPRRIEVSASDSGGTVVLTVADRAGGIPAGVLDRVFEPFFTTKAESRGTGLGLSFSYGVIADMNGTLTARNAAGGAVFEITLPAALQMGESRPALLRA